MENLEQKQPEIKSEEQGMPRRRNKLLLIALPICMLVVLVGAAVFNANRPIVRFKAALKNKDYSVADAIYEKNHDNQKFSEQSGNFVTGLLEELKDKYAKGTIPYEDVSATVAWTKDYDGVKNAEDIENSIREIKSSKDAYAKAEKHIESKQYLEAIEDYWKVSTEDEEHYANIRKDIDSAKENLCAEAIEEANELMKNGQLVEAFETLSDVYGYKNDAVEQLLMEVKDKAEEQVVDKEQELLDAGDYKTVCLDVESLPNGLKTDKITAIQKVAVTELIAQADEKEQAGNYDEALQLLTNDKGGSLLPQCDEKISEIKARRDHSTLKKYKGKLKISYDKISKKYTLGTFGNVISKSGVYGRISVENRSVSFGGIFAEYNEDLIFTDNIIIDCDGRQVTKSVSSIQRKTDIGFGETCEIVVFLDGPGTIQGEANFAPIVDSMKKAQEVTIRFSGSGGYKDVSVSQSQINNFVMTWDVYQILERDPTLIKELL